MSLRNTSNALEPLKDQQRSHVSVWNLIQRFGSLQIYKRKWVSAFIIDETVIQIGSQHFRLWICVEPIHNSVLGIYISKERKMFVAMFIKSLVEKYGSHTVYTDGGTWWYPQACICLHLKHQIHSSLEKSLIERMSNPIF